MDPDLTAGPNGEWKEQNEMELTEQQQRRLVVVRSYHEYVRALQMARLNQDSAEVRDTRRALGRAIEAGCASDPHLLEDFKRAFAARQLD